MCVCMTELMERPFELLGSQSERDRDRDVRVDSQDTAESQDTADSQSKSGLSCKLPYFVCFCRENVFFLELLADVVKYKSMLS